MMEENVTTDNAALDRRMKEAGMLSLSEMLERNPLGRFAVHAGVRDLATFEEWLVMRRKSMLGLQISLELDNKSDDELYEWAVAHAASFGEVLSNFRAAMGRPEFPCPACKADTAPATSSASASPKAFAVGKAVPISDIPISDIVEKLEFGCPFKEGSIGEKDPEAYERTGMAAASTIRGLRAILERVRATAQSMSDRAKDNPGGIQADTLAMFADELNIALER